MEVKSKIRQLLQISRETGYRTQGVRIQKNGLLLRQERPLFLAVESEVQTQAGDMPYERAF